MAPVQQPVLTPQPQLAHVRLLLPQQASGTWESGCEHVAAEAVQSVGNALSVAGFTVTTYAEQQHDARVNIQVTVKKYTQEQIDNESSAGRARNMRADPCHIAFGAIAIEPGAVQTFTGAAGISPAVQLLQSSSQVQALASRSAPSEGAPSAQHAAPSTAAASAAAAASPAFATGATRSDAYALVIGIEGYRDVPAPPGARADAMTFRGLALSTLGVPEANLHVLLDERASKTDVERQLAWLAANVPDGGRLYFYFAGHGAPSTDGSAYLLPYDGDAESIEVSGLPLQIILSRLSASKAREVVAFTDACFSGAGGRSLLPKGARPLVRVKQGNVPARVALFAAAEADQISGPAADQSSGLFTATLASGLGGARADIDGDGAITLAELDQWVTPRVERDARRQNRAQRPSLSLSAGASSSGVVLSAGITPP